MEVSAICGEMTILILTVQKSHLKKILRYSIDFKVSNNFTVNLGIPETVTQTETVQRQSTTALLNQKLHIHTNKWLKNNSWNHK